MNLFKFYMVVSSSIQNLVTSEGLFLNPKSLSVLYKLLLLKYCHLSFLDVLCHMAKYNDKSNLDKTEVTFDVFDSARLALKMIEMSERI